MSPRSVARAPGAMAVLLGLLVSGYFAASVLLDDGSFVKAVFHTYVHSLLMVVAAVLTLRAAARAGTERAAWWSMAVALVAFGAGEVTWRFVYADDPAPPFPSWADLPWLLSYPSFYLSVMLLLRARIAALSSSAWLDGLIAAVLTMAAGMAFYAQPVLEATDGDPVAVAVTMAYPLGDLLLLALLVAVIAIAGGRLSRASALIALGLAAIAVGDVFYALGTAQGNYVEGEWPDVLWPLGVLLIAWAAHLPTTGRRPSTLDGWRALALPSTLVALAIALEVLGDLSDVPLATQVLTKVAFALVLVRVALTVRENLTLVAQARQQAFCDELTGLANRRRLLSDLDALLGDEPPEPHALALFDLDGFKAYNDAFGHSAGDALLADLGADLAAAVAGRGRAYRLGGDEFCVLVDARRPGADAVVTAACDALREEGKGFSIVASHGIARMPAEARDAAGALKLADERMYRDKGSRRVLAADPARDELLGVLGPREPALRRVP